MADTVLVSLFGRLVSVPRVWQEAHERALVAAQAAYEAWGVVRSDCDHRGAMRAYDVAYNRSMAESGNPSPVVEARP